MESNDLLEENSSNGASHPERIFFLKKSLLFFHFFRFFQSSWWGRCCVSLCSSVAIYQRQFRGCNFGGLTTASPALSRTREHGLLHGHLFYFACPHGLRNKRGRNSDQPPQENLTQSGGFRITSTTLHFIYLHICIWKILSLEFLVDSIRGISFMSRKSEN